jgi:hypothetical protein
MRRACQEISECSCLEADVEKIQRAVRLLEEALARAVKDASDFDLSARLQDARELLSKRSG